MTSFTDKLIEWYGIEKYRTMLQKIYNFWQGKGRFIVSVQSSYCMYRQERNSNIILEQAIKNLEHQALLPGINMPTFFADFGTTSTAKYWGGKEKVDSTGTNWFITPAASTILEALKLTPLKIDHSDMDAYTAICLFNQIKEKLSTSHLWLRIPDTQGPLNTASLIIDQENFL